MCARVFVSCSQDKKNKREMEVVHEIKGRLETEFNLDVLVAVDENHWNGNPKLIEALKECDYFLFIDFERRVANRREQSYFSLYSHQELAIALALGFDETNMLIFHKKKMAVSGMLSYIFSNVVFKGYSDVVDVIVNNVKKEKWGPNYSRKLVAHQCELSKDVADWRDTYSLPRTGAKNCPGQRLDMSRELRRERIATIPLQNRRNDIAAMNCVVHLKSISEDGDFIDRAPLKGDSIDRAPIKAARLNGFAHTIWPGETVEFDLFGYDVQKEWIFMHTECDVTTQGGSRKPLINKPGKYILTYEVYAEHFPVSTFRIRVWMGTEYEDGIEISLCSEEGNSEQTPPRAEQKSWRNLGQFGEHEPSGTGFVP